MAKECVVLVHGLGRTKLSMFALQRSLESAGFAVQNLGYPSTRQSIEELSPAIARAINGCMEAQSRPIHVVTHSMGGILLRQYLQDYPDAAIERVVMLAPPNHGSEIADRYKDTWWYRLATGPAGQQLGTDPASVPNRLGPAQRQVGVIAGNKSSDPWFSALFAGPHDGKVSVASAQLQGMQDFLVVDSGHTWMANSREVSRQVLSFLKEGKFARE